MNFQSFEPSFQLFGDDPPPELVHISQNDDIALAEGQRDSVITLLSVNISLNPSPLDSHISASVSESPTVEIPPVEDQSNPASPVDISPEEDEERDAFAARRRRAAKLSRFFGVGHLSSSLLETSPSVLPLASSDEVDVRMTSGRRMWGFLEETHKDTNMEDVMGKLRGLRAS